jgi:hypothetical protein
MVPQGVIDNIEFLVFVPPEAYFSSPSQERVKVAHVVGQLNKKLEGKNFLLVGPGRWGSNNSDIGVPVEYSDIFNSRALVELAGKNIGSAPEPSLGTHFFQDLLEAQIFPLAIFLDDNQNVFQNTFFYHLPNHLNDFLKVPETMLEKVRVLNVADYRKDHHLKVIMNSEQGLAIGFIV